MSRQNIVVARLNGWKSGRVWLLTAALMTLACAWSPGVYGGVGVASPFREVVVARGARCVQSDRVRFAWGLEPPSGYS